MSLVRSAFRLAGPVRLNAVHVVPPSKLEIFVKFECFNVTTKTFDPVPNIPVDLMDNDPVSNDLIDTETTDATGLIHYSILQTVVQQKSGEPDPDLFFNARPSGVTIGGLSLPAKWSTKGWVDVSGQPGFYPKFSGLTLGSAAAPLVFRIGLDFHCSIKYKDNGSLQWEAPKGVLVAPRCDSSACVVSTVLNAALHTDEKGEIHGVLFNAEAEEEFHLHVLYRIEDPSINLPLSFVHDVQALGWDTSISDADNHSFPKNTKTSIGTPTTPEVFLCSLNNRNVALFFMTILYEWNCFLFNITGGAWTGVSGLEMFETAIAGTAYSWPAGEVNIPPSDFWDRGTIIHELTHQAMWKEAGVSSLSVGCQVATARLGLYHEVDLLKDPTHAVIEGWAEFLESVFDRSIAAPWVVSSVHTAFLGHATSSPVPLGPPPLNQGESVEGAFSNGLDLVFRNYVVATGTGQVPRSNNGNVTQTAAWLTDPGVKSRFAATIWAGLHALSSFKPTTTDFIAKMKSMNPSLWHQIVGNLNKFNMAMEAPTITGISPANGPIAGGQFTTITGTGFVNGASVAIGGNSGIGGNSATGIVVVNSTTLTFITPSGTKGSADITITTSGGTVTSPKTYTYF